MDLRWTEALDSLPPMVALTAKPLTWSFGSHPHFLTERGFAVTYDHGDRCHVLLAPKLREQTVERIEGIIRHELGHVFDFMFDADTLDVWARQRAGKVLSRTAERRADDIAAAIWGWGISYDDDQVQTLGIGQWPRPEALGL